MKKLVVVGAALVVLAVALYSLRPQSVTAPAPATPAHTDARALQTSAGDEQPSEDTELAPTDDVLFKSDAALPEDERKLLAECRALWERQHTRQLAARAAEAKDQAWAYPMEQKLREYLTRRFQTIPVEVILVECKTSYCDIRARGFSEETSADFNRVVGEVPQQAWNDFSGTSMWAEEEPGKLTFIAELHRTQPYEKAVERTGEQARSDACMALTSRRSQREQAARDSQPTDASWSDQMEPLLRDHIVRQMAKHPIEGLEVDCRTSFCRIKAKGDAKDSLNALRKVVLDMASEPWANLRKGEAGSSGYGDSWTADFTLYRQ
jgi:hypothetical protein